MPVKRPQVRTTTVASGKRGRADVTSTVNQWLSGLEQFFQDVDENALTAAKLAGNKILLETLPFTPMKTGKLRKSGRVEVVKNKARRGSLQVRVAFGNDTDVRYAVYVHENMPTKYPNKNYTTPGTGPKYLKKGAEKAFNDVKKIFFDELRLG